MKRFWLIMLILALMIVPTPVAILTSGPSKLWSPVEALGHGLVWLILVVGLVLSIIVLVVHAVLKRRAEAAGRKGGVILEVVRDFGIGAFVVCTVGAIFDYSLHSLAEHEYNEKLKEQEKKYNERLDEITKDVFKASFGVVLAEELRKEMGDTIFRYPHLVRDNLTLTFQFEPSKGQNPPPGGEKLLDLTFTVSYDLKNTGVTMKDHQISPSFDDPPTLGPVGRFLRLDVEGCLEKDIHRDADKEGNITVYNKQNRTIKGMDKDGRIKIAPDAVVTVKWVYKTQRRYADKYTWVTGPPARNITLLVKKNGEELKDLQFAWDTAHRVQYPEEQQAGPGGRLLEEGEKCWMINAAFLPFQGVILDWYPASKVLKD